MTFKRRVGGFRAKFRGKGFENLLIASANNLKWEVVQIPAGCDTKRIKGRLRIIRVQTPFDFVFVEPDSGRVIFCDAKNVSTGTLNPGLIKTHQLNALMKLDSIPNIEAGYIVNFEKEKKVVFFDTKSLFSAVKSRKGLNSGEGIALGHKFEVDLRKAFAIPMTRSDDNEA